MNDDNFQLDYKGYKITVQRLTVANQIIYRAIFPDKRAPLVLTRAIKDTYDKFWTSIPEGRQKEAEEIGPLIAEHIRSTQT